MDIDALINRYGGTLSTAKAADGMPNIDDLARRYGSGFAPVAPQTASIAAPTQVSTAPDNIPFDASQFSTPTPPQGNTQSQSGYLSNAAYGIERLFKEAPKGTRISNIPGNVGSSIAEHFSGAVQQGGQALSELASGDYRPTGRFTDPSTWKPGGLLRGAASVVGMPGSLVSGPMQELVEKPVAGMFGPEAGQRAGFLASSAVPVFPGARLISKAKPSNRAFEALVDSIGPENISSTVNALRENPRLSIMDAAPGARMKGQGLAVSPGPHQPSFDQFVKDRTSGTKAAVKDAYDTAMGTSVNFADKIDELKQAARKVGKDAIEPALAKTGPVNITPVIKHIDDLANPGINSIVSMGEGLPGKASVEAIKELKPYLTNGKSVQTDPTILNKFQSDLRAKADNLLNSATAADREVGYHLMNFRNKIVDAIDASSGGTYKNALSKYRDEKQIDAAFQRGRQLNKNSDNLWESHPDFVERWVKGLSKEEKQAAQEGARLAMRDSIGRVNDPRGLQGTKIVNIEYNLDKARMLFDPNEINTMVKKLEHERNIAQTNADVMHGSQTAFREKQTETIPQQRRIFESKKDNTLSTIAALGAEATNMLTGATGIPGAGMVLYGASKAASKGMSILGNVIHNKSSRSENNQLSNLVQSTAANKELMDKLIERAPKPQLSTSKRAINALSRAVQPLLPP